MNILAICCALNNTYLGFEFDDKKIHKIIKSDENYHSLYLISEIKKIIKENNFSLNKLDFICVNSGPGSFTGIRVALTVAKVIAGELNIPLVTLDCANILLKFHLPRLTRIFIIYFYKNILNFQSGKKNSAIF